MHNPVIVILYIFQIDNCLLLNGKIGFWWPSCHHIVFHTNIRSEWHTEISKALISYLFIFWDCVTFFLAHILSFARIKCEKMFCDLDAKGYKEAHSHIRRQKESNQNTG